MSNWPPTEETKQKMRGPRKGSKPVVVNGVEYTHLAAASEATGILYHTIKQRAESATGRFDDTYFVGEKPVKDPNKVHGNIGVKRSPVSEEAKLNRRKNYKGREIYVEGIKYNNILDASDTTGISRQTLRNRANNRFKFNNIFFTDQKDLLS